jgi:formamidopyrimidine-DNA glycosylase
MPELPEVETIARDLDAELRGATIVGVRVRRADVLREVTAATLGRRVRGARIRRGWRRAKLVVIDLSTEDRLVIQPRFTGGLLIDDGRFDASELRYSTMAFQLEDGRRLHYRDVRRLGTVALMRPARFATYTGRLGPEPLEPEFDAAHLAQLLSRSRQAVKRVLMDQTALAGVGNIYANEALWRAGIDPSLSARRIAADRIAPLYDAVVGVLRESIALRGTSARDYRDPFGERGAFVERLDVYGRAGLPCRHCGARLIGTHAIDGRATVFCAHCQS